MAKKTLALPSASPAIANQLVGLNSLALTKKAQAERVASLLHAIELHVVEDEESYLTADTLLGQVAQARLTWKGVWDRFYEVTVAPLRQALDGAYAMNREVDGPLEKAEKTLRTGMVNYKREELRRNQEAERKRLEEAQRLQVAIEQAEAAAAAAKTKFVAKRQEAIAHGLKEEQAEVILHTPTVITGAHSTTRVAKMPQVRDMAEFATGVLAGGVEMDEPMQAALRLWLKREYKKDPDAVASWPGVEIVDEPTIVRR